jgi:hypothetical protein
MYSNHDTPPVCHGTHCFQMGFYICTALCGVSCLLSSALTMRRKSFYQLLHKCALALFYLQLGLFCCSLQVDSAMATALFQHSMM